MSEIATTTNEKVSKGERTRERILAAALELFAEQGFEGATMRGIAERAECSLGLAYRYFRTKEEMVLALYERLVEELAAEAKLLPPGSLASRWAAIERADIARLLPHRATLTALFGAGLTPGSPTQVLGEGAAHWRRRIHAVFHEVVAGASDIPKGPIRQYLPTLLYTGHLLLVLFWAQDPTPNQKATTDLLAFGEEMLGRLWLALRLPWAAQSAARLGAILEPLFGSPPLPPSGSEDQPSDLTKGKTLDT
ncbi:MAG: TetR/AcrR family transcriptional regulator [Armatimonadetes bacterium]|jgi:AcrR family transcriptional regulator|nr:TetR/AcrR family transcriptional regulator [Armatimonadota bacterium]